MEKQPVFALVHYETREVRSMVVNDVTAKTLAEKIREHTDVPNLYLQTDTATAYMRIGQQAADHQMVNHSAGQYKLKGGAGTNLAEGFFSQLKRSLDGTHHHVSTVHLDRYLAQFDWLRTYCKMTDSQRMRLLLGRVAGRRLTYKPVAGQA